jgi:glycogen phosphorylase
MSELYDPAHLGHARMTGSGYTLARERAGWNAKVRDVWDKVRFVDAGNAGPGGSLTSGKPVPVRAAIELAGLSPGDVRVEAVFGRVNSNGHLEDTEVLTLPSVEQQGSVAVFSRDIVPERTGRLGYALRVSPNHFDDPITRPCTNLLKWSGLG